MSRLYAATIPVGLLLAVFVCRDLDVPRVAFVAAWAAFTVGLAGLARFAQMELDA